MPTSWQSLPSGWLIRRGIGQRSPRATDRAVAVERADRPEAARGAKQTAPARPPAPLGAGLPVELTREAPDFGAADPTGPGFSRGDLGCERTPRDLGRRAGHEIGALRSRRERAGDGRSGGGRRRMDSGAPMSSGCTKARGTWALQTRDFPAYKSPMIVPASSPGTGGETTRSEGIGTTASKTRRRFPAGRTAR